MDGVKTAIIGFIFVCIIFPSVIKNRSQYYMGLAAVILSMLFQMLAYVLHSNQGVVMTAHALEVLLEVLAILILILAAGGLSARELASDMGRAIEVMRRGEETSEVIIPLPGRGVRSKEEREPPRERIVLDDDDNDPLYDPKRFNPGGTTAAPTAPPPAAAGSVGPIPLEEPKRNG